MTRYRTNDQGPYLNVDSSPIGIASYTGLGRQ
jgi:hypothetical protein